MVARRQTRAPLLALALLAFPVLWGARLAAQVSVTPDGGSTTAPPNATNQSVTFMLSGLLSGTTYSVGWSCDGMVCSSPRGSSFIAHSNTDSWPILFNTAASGTRTVTLTVSGNGSDQGSYVVTVAEIYRVSVTPDSRTQTVVGTVARKDTFRVTNTGNMRDEYRFACSSTGSETCGAWVNPPSQVLNPGAGVDVEVDFTPGAVGTSGTLVLTATSTFSSASDNGSFVITNGPPPLVVSMTPYHDGFRPAGSFDVTETAGTPAYVSMGDAHAVTLTYRSAAVRPTPVVLVDVTDGPPYPSKRSIEVRRASSGQVLTLLNGAPIAWYTAGTAPARLAAAIDAKANGLATGFHPVNVTVTSYYSWGPTSKTVSTRLLVEDLSAGALGAGWSVAGLQRVLFQPGSDSVTLDNGDGSLSYFASSGSGSFTAPAGDPSRLVWNPNASVYARAYPDGDTVYFRADGRMSKVVDVKQVTRRTLTWTDTLLTAIQDVAGKTLTLGYAAGRLQSVTDPSGRVTTFSIDGSQRLYRVTLPNGDATNFAYDAQLRLTTITDAAGGVWDYTYDGLNRMASSLAPTIQDHTGASVRPTTTYVAAERVVWQPGTPGTDSIASKAHLRADTVLATVTDPVGSITRAAYDRFGGPTKVVDPLGQVTTIDRDALGQPVRVREPNGHVTTSTYSGYQITQTFDSMTLGRVNYTWSTCGSGPKRILTISGDVVRQDFYYGMVGSSCPGGWLDSVYVGNTGTWAAPTGGTTIEKHYRDAWGRDTMVADGTGHTTRVAYKPPDEFGNAFQVTDPIGRVVAKYHHDNAGRVDTSWVLSNGAYGPTVSTYDSLNRVRSVKNALGHVTQYQYGPLGPTRVIDANGQVYKFTLNALGAVSLRHDLADTTKADTLKYDVGSRLRVLKTRRGDQLSFTYDTVGRVLTRSGPDFPVDSFRYDPQGRWVVATNAHAYDSVAFDVRGRLTSSLERLTGFPAVAMAYTYDNQDRLTQRSAPTVGGATVGRRVQVAYHPTKGVVTKWCAAAGCLWPQNLDIDNIPHTTAFTDTLANPAWSRVDTTDERHLETANGFVTNTGTPITLNQDFRATWSYDSLGRIGAETQQNSGSAGGPRYTYDAIGQLVRACNAVYPVPGGPQFTPVCLDEYGNNLFADDFFGNTYAFDAAGNRAESAAGAVVGPGNRVTQFKGYVLAYDLNGNVVSKSGTSTQFGTDTTQFTWDALGRLTSVTTWPAGGAHTTVTFAYDALGRRVTKTVNGVTQWYAHDGDQVALSLDGASSLKAEFGWGPGMDNLAFVRTPSWVAAAITRPQIGTLRGLTSLTPGAPLRKRYATPSPWGEAPADTGIVIPVRMGGQEYDQETKLYYLRARYYDPQLGRFVSEDPIGIAGGLNLYAYAGNDPINRTDPSGLATTTLCGGWAMWIWECPGAHGNSICFINPWSVHCGGSGDPFRPPSGLDYRFPSGRGGTTGTTSSQENAQDSQLLPYRALQQCPALNRTVVSQLANELNLSVREHLHRGGYYRFGPNRSVTMRMTSTQRGLDWIQIPHHPGASGFWHTHQNPQTTHYQGPDSADLRVSRALGGPMLIRSLDSLFIVYPDTTTAVGCAP